MNCSTYFRTSVPACSTAFEVRAHLTPDQQYTWTVRDMRFNTHYVGQATADANGTITIPTSAPFPPGLFNQYAGSFEITVKRTADQCGASLMTFCVDDLTSQMFYGALIEFHESVGLTVPAIIGCNCGMVPPEQPDNSAAIVFPFTNTATITITHNLGRVVQAAIFDSLGNQIQGSIVSTNLNQIQIVLSQALSGTVVID